MKWNANSRDLKVLEAVWSPLPYPSAGQASLLALKFGKWAGNAAMPVSLLSGAQPLALSFQARMYVTFSWLSGRCKAAAVEGQTFSS